MLLLYEAAEGGAGVLRRLVDEPQAFAGVAAEAMRVCHYDPETGTDQGGPKNGVRCEAACYDCLLSYRNQPEHMILDRQAAVEVLKPLRAAVVRHTEQARRDINVFVQSELEQEWLEYVRKHGYREPDDAQMLIPAARTRPDFVYRDAYLAVYIDGPHHEFPDRAERDATQMTALRDCGWTPVRFGYKDNWSEQFQAFKSVFGEGHR